MGIGNREPFFRDVGDGEGDDALDGDHHAEVLLDALEDALDTFEGTLADDDLLAGLEGELHVLELYDLLVGILDDANEILHLPVGNLQESTSIVIDDETDIDFSGINQTQCCGFCRFEENHRVIYTRDITRDSSLLKSFRYLSP